MKLEKFEDKSMSKRKVLLISLGIIMLISVSLLLYKNKNLKENDDVYFAFYNGNEKLESMPLKDNAEDLAFDHGECDNGATIEWNEEEWAPLVKNLSKSKTKCSLYFKKSFAKTVVKCGQEEKSATECITDNMNLDETLIYDDYNNLRYTGANPDNYVSFNDGELWRIIGIIDGKLKIIRSESIGSRMWDSSGSKNEWPSSDIASYLNNSYSINSILIESGSWNIGKAGNTSFTAKGMYSSEQETKWTGNVGLMSASDYGYAVGGNVRATCLNYGLNIYNSGNCVTNDWLLMKFSGFSWTMTVHSTSLNIAFSVDMSGYMRNDLVHGSGEVFPTVYLKKETRITGGIGEKNSPFILE